MVSVLKLLFITFLKTLTTAVQLRAVVEKVLSVEASQKSTLWCLYFSQLYFQGGGKL
jgi:hypothetical protein